MSQLYDSLSFKASEHVTRTYSTSFSVAVRMLPSRMRQSIHGIYGFVRLADEIVDTFSDTDQSLLFERFERDLNEALSMGMSMNPVIHAFVTTVQHYGIPLDHVRAFMDSMRADLTKKVYHTTHETGQYIYGSAEVVGLMCLMVFVNGNKVLYDQLEPSARSLGAAFQKVNFLRDLKADSEQLQRCYFSDLQHGILDEATKLKLVQDIEVDFNLAKEGIRKLPSQSKIAVFVAYLYFRQLLRQLKRTPARQIIHQRVRVSDSLKLALFVRAWLGYQLRMI